MKVVAPGVALECPGSSSWALERIEKIARVCYKSEDRITPGSAEKMVKMLIARGHESVLEHVRYCLKLNAPAAHLFSALMSSVNATRRDTVGLSYDIVGSNSVVISFNARTFRDAVRIDKYGLACRVMYRVVNETCPVLCDNLPEPIDGGTAIDAYHLSDADVISLLPDDYDRHLAMTFRFVCDRGVSHELVRHRMASFSQESTRFCNYGKTGEVQFIQPPGLNTEQGAVWLTAMQHIERWYLEMLRLGQPPQIARSVLPNSLKTEVVMTAVIQSWRDFFLQRTAPAAQPQMRDVACMALAIARDTPVAPAFDGIKP